VCQLLSLHFYAPQSHIQHPNTQALHGTSINKNGELQYATKKKVYEGGHYHDELDAAKRVNQLCEELGLKRKNSEVDAMPPPKIKHAYNGVVWRKDQQKWRAIILWKNNRYDGGCYSDELDAAKRVNQLCDKLGIERKNPDVNAICLPKVRKKYVVLKPGKIGIIRHAPGDGTINRVAPDAQQSLFDARITKRWKIIKIDHQRFSEKLLTKKQEGVENYTIELILKKHKQCKNNLEFLANEKQDTLYSQNNPAETVVHETIKQKLSQYKGVSWNEKSAKWYAIVHLKDNMQKFGGTFEHEMDAAKRVNQLCEEMEIPLQNPGIGLMPAQQYQPRKKTSQYKGVHYYKQRGKWSAAFYLEGKKMFAGYCNNELDAAKRVNQLCEKFGIPHKNPGINAIPSEQWEPKQKTSKYKGVYWAKQRDKWGVGFHLQGRKKFCGYFNDELDAAKKVNQLCEKFGIPHKNNGINTIKNQQWQPIEEVCSPLLDYQAIQTECENLIKILDENNTHDALKIIQTIGEAILDRQETIMAEVNLQTKNGESVLSIAAQYGFSNVVKFLISKGANKEHFTNENHTPLSLAVSHNHLKVVQVLLEDWISPNSHEKPYLHLLPIFNVKSREIAQLLVENDAVTSDLYNNKNQSPLTVACQNGYLNVVQFFLDDGLDINHLDSDNKTPLFYALTNKHHDIANLLISKGAYNY